MASSDFELWCRDHGVKSHGVTAGFVREEENWRGVFATRDIEPGKRSIAISDCCIFYFKLPIQPSQLQTLALNLESNASPHQIAFTYTYLKDPSTARWFGGQRCPISCIRRGLQCVGNYADSYSFRLTDMMCLMLDVGDLLLEVPEKLLMTGISATQDKHLSQVLAAHACSLSPVQVRYRLYPTLCI